MTKIIYYYKEVEYEKLNRLDRVRYQTSTKRIPQKKSSNKRSKSFFNKNDLNQLYF